MFLRVAIVSVVIWRSLGICVAQDTGDCPAGAVVHNGVCRDKDGNDCSKNESPTLICHGYSPEYTAQAAKAKVRGTVRLTAVVGSDGCAHNIIVVKSLGYGLDEASVSALERFRFQKREEPTSISVEFTLDPQFSSKTPLTAPKCVDVSLQKSRSAE